MPFEIRLPEDPSVELSKKALYEFTIQLEKFLGDIVEEQFMPGVMEGVLNAEIELLRSAYYDLVKNVRAFRMIEEGISVADDRTLFTGGLTGPNLRYKLNTLTDSSQEMLELANSTQPTWFGYRPIRKILEYLLKLVNSILGSLQSVIAAANPVLGGAVHAVKELKDFIEAKVGLVNDLG
ncbi:hypothetical protein J7394_00035 [Ruegeria sp. R13_0]|uniref:hypothetical protein n=1 Tax=Ruegeria sp. R13_0 TaxID=2821099 RepID=UPI001AD9D56D|nr:hypothetical protein [Ruegeria sp. R13_0]MBO9432572.1 hypothetical protein [Ruegeria sp. R13_0]